MARKDQLVDRGKDQSTRDQPGQTNRLGRTRQDRNRLGRTSQDQSTKKDSTIRRPIDQEISQERVVDQEGLARTSQERLIDQEPGKKEGLARKTSRQEDQLEKISQLGRSVDQEGLQSFQVTCRRTSQEDQRLTLGRTGKTSRLGRTSRKDQSTGRNSQKTLVDQEYRLGRETGKTARCSLRQEVLCCMFPPYWDHPGYKSEILSGF